MKKPALWYRIRGLQKMERRFGKGSITKFIDKRLKTENRVRILEIGFGEGKCLLELRRRFPDSRVELYGVNNKKEGNMHSRSDFIKNAKRFKLPIPRRGLLPKPFFFDAGARFSFQSNFFDLIISQVCAPYVDDKGRLLEEVWRILKPSGAAFLHLDTYETTYPDFMALNTETPRFLIYSQGKMVKVSTYLRAFQRNGFDIALAIPKTWRSNRILFISKTKRTPLRLGLTLDKKATFNLTQVRASHPKKDYKQNPWWGARSVFYADN